MREPAARGKPLLSGWHDWKSGNGSARVTSKPRVAPAWLPPIALPPIAPPAAVSPGPVTARRAARRG